MSQITLTPDEVPDFVVAFLMDNFKNEDLLRGNPLWAKYMDNLKAKGVEAHTVIYYLHMDAETRLKYKRISKVFDGKIQSAKIVIQDNASAVKKRKKKDSKLKRIIKTVFKIVKEERYKTSMPITEQKMNKIIDYVMKHEDDETEEEEE
jgi:transposase-like protein